MNRKAGIIILELLAAIAISTVIIAAGFSVLSVLMGQLRSAGLRKEEIFSALLYRQELLKMLNGLDSHRLPLEPLIHRNGEIRYANGSINPISRRYDSISPATSSDAFTRTALDFGNFLRVEKIHVQGGDYIADFKALGPSEVSTGFRHFLGLSLDGVVELSALTDIRSTKIKLSIPLASMIARQADVDPLTLMGLVPIVEIVTIYTDKSGELRYLAHKGEMNIENQPLGKGPQQVLISNQLVDGFYLLKASLEFNNSRTFEFLGANRLQRADLLTILLNL